MIFKISQKIPCLPKEDSLKLIGEGIEIEADIDEKGKTDEDD